MPNAEFHAPWYREPMRASMPRHIYETLSEHGQYIARYIVAQPGEELATGFRDDLGTTSAGVKRQTAKADLGHSMYLRRIPLSLA